MPRTLWSGHIAFGLVNVPVRLATAVRDRDVHFHLLSEDGSCRLRRKLYCPETGKEYDFKDTSRGFEIAPDQYVIVRDEELEELRPESGRTIDISTFVELAEIDPIYYDRTYILLPDEGGAKGYRLLIEAMRSQKRVALARFAMRQREHLAALRVMDDDTLVLHTMHYADEIAEASEFKDDLPGNVEITKKETDMAKQLIDSLTEPFEPEQFTDRYREEIKKLIEAKSEGQEVVTAPSPEEESVPVYNIMDALKKSIDQNKSTSRKSSKKKTAKTSKRKRAS